MTGIKMIAKERQEQIEKHGHTPETDQKYDCGELLYLARWLMACADIDYSDKTLSPDDADMDDFIFDGYQTEDWTDESYVKFPKEMRNQLYRKPYLEKLAIAGALIAAVIK